MVEDREPVLPFGSFLFPRIFQAFRMSIQPTKLLLAFLALATICLTGRIMDIHKTVPVTAGGFTELDLLYTAERVPTAAQLATFRDTEERTGVFTTLWNFGATRFHHALTALAEKDVVGVTRNVAACYGALLWAFRYHTVYSILFFAVALGVMSVSGGAICRIAALQFAQGEKPGLLEAFHFGRKKFWSFLMAPVAPFAVAVAVGLSIALLGLVGCFTWFIGDLAIGLFLPFAFLSAALIAVIVIGVVAGFNLMFPAIAYEDSDCLDANSRAFSYVYAKPWHMGFYTVMATIYGAVCYAFVRLFTYLLLWITRQFLALGFIGRDDELANIWPAPDFTDFLGSAAATPTNWSTSAGAFLIYVWVLIVVGLMVSFVISFYFSANTIIYALMRNRVDRTRLDEIYTGTDEMAAEPMSFAAPPQSPAAPAEAEPASDRAEKPETSE